MNIWNCSQRDETLLIVLEAFDHPGPRVRAQVLQEIGDRRRESTIDDHLKIARESGYLGNLGNGSVLTPLGREKLESLRAWNRSRKDRLPKAEPMPGMNGPPVDVFEQPVVVLGATVEVRAAAKRHYDRRVVRGTANSEPVWMGVDALLRAMGSPLADHGEIHLTWDRNIGTRFTKTW